MSRPADDDHLSWVRWLRGDRHGALPSGVFAEPAGPVTRPGIWERLAAAWSRVTLR